ncbi:MOSC domain-containing protein [Pseudofrankia sp. DC12]|uniref:MOSC domain-containing protein n=1 Tax=Pseudofrankia sp. DC12 TaxID=683315 RepID=UPI0005F8146B|nr:MOSC domain-containing protein [Pseudofrankia sp. DC12]
MGVSTGPRVSELYRYPVKGLTGERLDEVALAAGDGVPGDRMFALALPSTEFDEDRPVALGKRHFLMLMRDETLARVRTGYDPGTRVLTVDDGASRWSADLGTAAGRRSVEEYFGALAAPTAGTSGDGGLPRLVAAQRGHRFTDAGPSGPELMRAVSLLNLASVRDFAERVGQAVDPLRFRANLHLDGVAAWAERDWVGQEILVGPARLRVLRDIPRCAATMVNPRTAERDLKVLKELQTHYGHTDCGSYATVLTAGTVRPGDPVTLLGAAG